MTESQVFVMPDNNPNEMVMLVIGILAFYIVLTLISVLIMRKRRQRLKEAQTKLKAYQRMMEARESEIAYQDASDFNVLQEEGADLDGQAI